MISTRGESARYCATGYQMINAIKIENFRCFARMTIEGCRRVNVIVGDNGSGKTALLEALFMALCSESNIAARLRQHRGLEGTFSGSARAIEDALFRDFFHDRNWSIPVHISLSGDGPEARSLHIVRGTGEVVLPLDGPDTSNEMAGPVSFTWRDFTGRERTTNVHVSQKGIQFGSTGEDLPDFFLFAANQTVTSVESASRFSELSRARRERQFVEVFTREYDWIEDLGIEVVAGSPVIHATVKNTTEKIPVNNISGAINRIMSVMLALSVRPRTVVLVDELENGIYHKHYEHVWRSFLGFAREYDSQLFTTTHNEEWLEALVAAAGKQLDDIALWRLERTDGQPILRQFSGKQTAAAIKAGEVR